MIVRQLKEHGIFVLILAACVLLRFVPLFDYQFTLDELSGLCRTEFGSFGELIDKGVKIDAHPALIQLLIFYLSKCFGYDNWIIKLPFLFMSFGAVIYSYLFSLRNFSKQSAVFSALLFSFSLIFVFYAPIARMYIPGVFFSIALLYYFFEILFLKNTRWSNYFFFGVFALLSALNQHINALFALTLCVSGCLFLDKQSRKAYLLTCALAVVCYLPHLPVTLYQLGIGGIGFEQNGWLAKPKVIAVFGFMKIVLGTGRSWLVFVFLICLAVVLKKDGRMDRRQFLLLSLFLVNFAIVFVYSIYKAAIYQHSVMLFSGVAFIVLVTSVLNYRNRYVFAGAALLVAGTLVYKTYVKKDYLHQAVKTVFEYQFERTAYYQQQYGREAVYPIFMDADVFMKKIYSEKYGTFDCKITDDSLTFSTRHFTRFIAALQADYVILASSTPLQQAVVRQHFPYLLENTQTQAVNFKLYSRRKQDEGKTVPDDARLAHSDAAGHGVFGYGQLREKTLPVPLFSFPVDSMNEFPFDAKARYSDFITAEGQVILATARYYPQRNRLTTCISVNDEATNENYNYASKEAGEFVPAADSTLTVFVENGIGTKHLDMKDHSWVSVYVWNRGHDPFTLKSFEVSLIDYWWWKWHFWD